MSGPFLAAFRPAICRIELEAVHVTYRSPGIHQERKDKRVWRIDQLTARVVQSGQGDRPSGNRMELEDRIHVPQSHGTMRTQSVRRLLYAYR